MSLKFEIGELFLNLVLKEENSSSHSELRKRVGDWIITV